MPKTIHGYSARSGKVLQFDSADCDRYGIITLATNDAVWDLDVHSKRIEWNDNFCHLFGYSHDDDIAGLDFWSDKLHPDDLDRVSSSLQAAMEGETDHWEEEYRFRKADGTYAYVLDRGFVLRDKNHQPVRMLGAMQDITSRKHAEEQLRRSEQRFRALLEHSSDITALIDAQGRVIYTTPTRHRILGFSPSEALGRNVFEFLLPDDRGFMRERFSECLHQPGKAIHIEARAIHRNGTIRSLEGTIKNLLHDSAIKAIVCNYRDITKRKQADEERSRLATIIETTSDLVGIADADLRIFYLNKAARETLQIPPTENICQMSIKEFHTTSSLKLILGTAIPLANEQGRWKGEATLLARNGVEIPVSQMILAHKNASGKVEFYSTVMRDISDRKRVENAIREANLELEQRVQERTAQLESLNKELQTFSYSVSHDLRTPIRAIQGLSEAIQQDCGASLSNDCQDYFDRLVKATQK
ncbi:MAG: PAS domain S-box protein, partial [Limisphaerales bacterium]